MTQELIEQIYGGEKTAEATKLLKYIYAGAQPIEDNDFALMFGRMNLAKFVEVKAKEDEIIARQSKKLKEEHHKTNSRLGTELQEARNSIKDKERDIDILTKSLQEAHKYIKDLEQKITELENTVKEKMKLLGHESELRGENLELQHKLNEKSDEIVEKNTAIDELKAEREKLSEQVNIYKMDNFDLQADIDRLRHQLEAIKNIIAL